MPHLDPNSIRADFPILDQEINGRPLVYLDNAATSQTPRQVMEASRDYYSRINANIHRAAHKLAREATLAHEAARSTVSRHMNSRHEHEIIFTSGTTDAINLVSNTLSLSGKIGRGDTVVISGLEHHSNIVPWQMLCERTGATLKVIPVLDDGSVDMEAYADMLDDSVRLVAVNHVSNALGTINPIEEIIAAAKAHEALVLIDGAQAMPHLNVDVQQLGCDFYAFSGHKIYGPTGIGVLFGKEEILDTLPPWRGGGEMIKEVTFEHTTYNDLPFKYEAGTPDIEGAIAMAAAIDYMNALGMENIAAHENTLQERATAALQDIDGIRIYGTTPNKASVISFSIGSHHHYDLGMLMDQMGVALRTGHHCCQPLMARFGITGTARASFAAYNTEEEVDLFIEAVKKASMMLG
ncbi:cysteine desulfurase [Verrucomicrobiaceae bacterium R5-34]|uniref:Cysteine desulfurase n=1 Tax=Oceaniferula flava TaxID=2800421 RepID=A0AAE2V7W1_9BACT|nr:cysteine desulfurase [Oceaniferula flavus]MBK1830440.1 cysteine desulfurase [Verrucomicrobiaceae bacterium R5-34]MBK1854532.1 cysteine desulfurase [Oceaniferula flavus]MBM1135838.1 cysteine desulfurase [Oceaniferula flavus]